MTGVEARARELCAAPAGCAFLLIVEEAGLAPEAAADPVAATWMAAVAVDEVRPWNPAHERVVAMALEHGPRLHDLARAILAQPAAARWFGPLDRRAQQWVTSPNQGGCRAHAAGAAAAADRLGALRAEAGMAALDFDGAGCQRRHLVPSRRG